MGIREGYKETEVGVIPEDWEVSQCEEVVQIIDGDRGANYPNKSELEPDGFCLFLNAGNVTKNGFSLENCEFVSKSKDESLRKGKLNRFDVVLTTRGTVGNFAYFDDTIPFNDIRINSGMVLLRRNNRDIENDYLFVVCSSQLLKDQIDRLSFGSAQPQLTVKGISNFYIPYPPTKTEQKTIAKALSDMDGLIEALNKLIAKKRAIKQATMQQLLTGKTRLPGFDGEWRTKTFGEIFEYFATATNSRSDLTEDDEIYYVHYGDIHTRFHNHIDFGNEQISKISRNKCKNAAFLKENDWIMADASEDYDGVGKSIEVLGLEDRKAVAGLHTFLLREKKSTYVPGFKGHLGNLKSLHDELLRVATGLKVYGVSKKALRDLLLPVPPPDEQTAIVTILSDIDTEITALTQRRNKTKMIKQGMMQELLTGRTRLVTPKKEKKV